LPAFSKCYRVWAFVDSDTAFTHPPHGWLDAVEQGRVVLHAQEGTIHGNRTHSRSQRRLDDACSRQAITVRGQAKRISGDAAMWNSGRDWSARQPARHPERHRGADRHAVPICPIHTVEQVALSIVLQDRRQPVRTCEADVLHYHTFKEFRGDPGALL
jgi:hypothetical protein